MQEVCTNKSHALRFINFLCLIFIFYGKTTSQRQANFEGKTTHFSHESWFFDPFVVEEFRKMHNSDKSCHSHSAMIIEIKT